MTLSLPVEARLLADQVYERIHQAIMSGELPAGARLRVRDLAAQLPEAEARAALARPDGARWFRDQALARVVEWQRTDLARYGVTFDRWFHESTLHPEAVDRTRTRLVERDVTYRAERPEGVTEAAEARVEAKEGAAGGSGEALWLRATRFGDSMDRVITRSDGRPTYLLPDIAYHLDKRERGYRRAINLWGPDHHAYIDRKSVV